MLPGGIALFRKVAYSIKNNEDNNKSPIILQPLWFALLLDLKNLHQTKCFITIPSFGTNWNMNIGLQTGDEIVTRPVFLKLDNLKMCNVNDITVI